MKAFLTLAALIAGSSAVAGELWTYTPPAGCTAHLTVQSADCTVSHFWTCEGDPAGHQWELTLNGDLGQLLKLIDYEYRWLKSFYPEDGTKEILVSPEQDPASLSELLSRGRDDMDFELLVSFGEGPSEVEGYRGYDKLTGETVVVDGEALLKTQYSMTSTDQDGQLIKRSSGNQFVSERFRIFLGGAERYLYADGSEERFDFSPVLFREPGEHGFLAVEPIFGCGGEISSLPLISSEKMES